MRGLKHPFCEGYSVDPSRTSQGVRGLKRAGQINMMAAPSRTSQGVRGLKLLYGPEHLGVNGSHLARGAWIETINTSSESVRITGRTSQGVRGLKPL